MKDHTSFGKQYDLGCADYKEKAEKDKAYQKVTNSSVCFCDTNLCNEKKRGTGGARNYGGGGTIVLILTSSFAAGIAKMLWK